MKRTRLRSIAAASLLLAFAPAEAERRPRYGGELRIEMRADPHSMDPRVTDPGEVPAEICAAVFETLVRLDERGDPQPWLALSWTHDPARKSWIFTPRAGVVLHDGSAWPPAPILISDDKPIEHILRELSRPKNAVVVRAADGSLLGTGPFRITRWEAGKALTLAANDAYWGGRPYLDHVEIRFGREYADQASDFQLARADVIETQLPAKKPPVSKAVSVLALQFDARVADAAREAAALSIDRAAIRSVILQNQGAASAALLPEWLSGYAFLFNAERNVARARQLLPSPVTIGWSYDAKNPLIRSIAQRIEVNVREAGITLRSGASRDAALIELPVTSTDPMIALDDMATLLKSPLNGPSPYEAERALVSGYRVIPIVHLPKAWSSGARVRNWPRLADVWIE